MRSVTFCAICLLVAGCGGKKVYDRDTFTRTFTSMHIDEVRKTLGKPDDITLAVENQGDPTRGGWTYKGITRKDADSKPDTNAVLIIERGRVSFITFTDP